MVVGSNSTTTTHKGQEGRVFNTLPQLPQRQFLHLSHNNAIFQLSAHAKRNTETYLSTMKLGSKQPAQQK